MGLKSWQTPPAYFRQRWNLFGLNIDAAADNSNALIRNCCRKGWVGLMKGTYWCDEHGYAVGRFFTAETDGLKPEHYERGDRVWCNPPYDASLIRWVKLARELSQDAGVLWDMLLPPSIETRWFQRYIWNDEAGHWRDGIEGHFLPYRLAFIDPDHPEKLSPRAGNLQVTFHPREVTT